MIDVYNSNAVYYYHYDGLGSVVALSDSAGDTVQTYEYSIYGRVAAENPNFLTNPYMFTGRRFDIETGLYYYRARCYNPYMGRFLQTDQVGYSAGMNLYAYCGNNPLNRLDPSGCVWWPSIIRPWIPRIPRGEELLEWLALYGGLWAHSLPEPAYPGTWTSWKNFFGWYAYGLGETVDLRKVGLLGDFKTDERIAAWREELENHADEMGKDLAKQILLIGKDKATITLDYKESFDFGGSFQRVLYHVVMGFSPFPSFSDPLVVLGNCTVEATMTITAERDPDQPNKAYWGRTIEYSMNDSFGDPGDIMDEYLGEVEWWQCVPYDIVANWASVNGGWIIGSPAP